MKRFAIKSFDSTPPASSRSFAVSLKTATSVARSVYSRKKFRQCVTTSKKLQFTMVLRVREGRREGGIPSLLICLGAIRTYLPQSMHRIFCV